MASLQNGEFDKAIQDFNQAIELKPNDANAYINRGETYHDKGNYDRAIEDYNKAIELNPNSAKSYNNQGNTYLIQKEWNKAKTDLTTAKDKGHDIVNAFHKEHQSIPTFENQYNVKPPPDIVALLTPEQ